MIKPLCVIQSPLDTRSGYGDMSRTIAHHFIDLNKYDVKLVSMPWGATPQNALDPNNPMDQKLLSRMVQPPLQLSRQPELFVQISVPNEFQPIGRYNIGITAGIETTTCSLPWLEGCNRMDVIFTISEHSKSVFLSTFAELRDQHGNVTKTVKVEKPVEVLHNCYEPCFASENLQPASDVDDALLNVKEKFCFLFVGHWLRGDFGHDRKNVSMMVKTFCETFKNLSSLKRPGLILKTSGAGFSILDRESILTRIAQIRASVGPSCPNVYLLHGEMTDTEMSSLVNHPKIKAHISLTHGEGFGRPLLEASISEKPVIASGWSGQLDFLNKDDALLVGGKLEKVHPSAVWENVIVAESAWFIPDVQQAAGLMMYVFSNYDLTLKGARRLAKLNREKFSYEAILARTTALVAQYVPKFAMETEIKLPSLKKLT